MKALSHIALKGLVCLVLSAGLAAGAQQQTPTIPKPTPNLSELRKAISRRLIA